MKIWIAVDEKGKIIMPCGSRLLTPKNGKYQWYKYGVISDKKYGALRQNNGHKVIQVEIRKVNP